MHDFNAVNWTGPDGLRPRHRRGIRHRLDHVLLLALAVVLAGQRHDVAISDGIHDLDPAARRRLGCPRWGDTYKVPSIGHGTGCTTRTGRKSGRGTAPGSWRAGGTPR